MATVAQVIDGKIVDSTSQTSLSTTSTSNNSMDKEAFLQLLVAQMKYQDPLEPTSNTEYISQYAQFSQVESLQNMSASMDLQRASALVGQEVYVKTTGASGETTLLQGRVEYVVYENGKPYLAINESLYSLDDLYTVSDKEYLASYEKATEWAVKLNKLPAVYNITTKTDGETIDELKKTYDEMTDYEKTFIASDYVTTLDKYVEKLEELRKMESAGNSTGSTEGTGEVENTGSTDAAGENENADTESTDVAGDDNESK